MVTLSRNREMLSLRLDHPVVPLYLKLIALVLLCSWAFIVGAALWWWVCGGVEPSWIAYPFTLSQTIAGQRTAEQGLGAACPWHSSSCVLILG